MGRWIHHHYHHHHHYASWTAIPKQRMSIQQSSFFQQRQPSQAQSQRRMGTTLHSQNDDPTIFLHSYFNDESSSNDTKKESIVITYLTDVEGDKAYLDRFVQASRVISYRNYPSSPSSSSSFNNNNNNNDHHRRTLPYDQYIDFDLPNGMLVYGGDVWDKGGYDLYVIRQLLDFKQRYPTRVQFVLGNRDINKLRILQELGLSSSSPKSVAVVPHHPGIYFFRAIGREADMVPPTTPVERLQWMLRQTMGSPHAFALRKSELEWERQHIHHHRHHHHHYSYCVSDNNNKDNKDNKNNNDMGAPTQAATADAMITDDMVVRSYQQSCHPQGEMGRYLSQAHLAIRLGQILFLHGSLPLTKEVLEQKRLNHVWDDLSFAMPWLTEQQKQHIHVTNIDDWIQQLNDFCHTKIQEWKDWVTKKEQKLLLQSSSTTNGKDDDDDGNNGNNNNKQNEPIWSVQGGYHYGPSYSALIQYGMGSTPDRKSNPTVVYSSWMTNGMPYRFYPPTASTPTNETTTTNSKEDATEDTPSFALATKEFLEKAGLRLIVAGHQPQGDLPNPIRIDIDTHDGSTQPAYVLCCDTSYSGDTMWYHLPNSSNENNDNDNDNDQTTMQQQQQIQQQQQQQQRANLGRGNVYSFRGEVAVSEVLLEINSQHELTSVKYHGVLSDGTEYETINLIRSPHQDDVVSIGQIAPESLVPAEDESPHQGPWWTKMIFSNGSYLFHGAEGFRVWNYMINPRKGMNPNDRPSRS